MLIPRIITERPVPREIMEHELTSTFFMEVRHESRYGSDLNLWKRKWAFNSIWRRKIGLSSIWRRKMRLSSIWSLLAPYGASPVPWISVFRTTYIRGVFSVQTWLGAPWAPAFWRPEPELKTLPLVRKCQPKSALTTHFGQKLHRYTHFGWANFFNDSTQVHTF